MAFHDVRFPTDISYGSIGGPEFSTDVVQLGSGHEQRNQNWTYARERWNVAYGVKSQDDLDTLREFFYARCGRMHGFRFKNHDDYSATGEQIGEGDGSTKTFQLVKTYTSGATTHTRLILKPIETTVAVYIDSVAQGSGWTVDDSTGIVTFTVAPGSGEIITADFEFDIPVRFDADYLPVALETYQARGADVPVVELKA